MNKLIIIVSLTFIILLVTVCPSGNGIVTLEDYGEAVAFCGYEYVAFPSDAHVIQEKDITYVINNGHVNDSEINELEELALVECAKYNNN